MNVIEYPKRVNWSTILKRPTQTVDDIESTVNQVFDDVKRNGDTAIAKYTSMFDGVELESMTVSESEIEFASSQVSEELKKAIQLAKSNIEAFHKAQKTDKVFLQTQNGVECWQEKDQFRK